MGLASSYWVRGVTSFQAGRSAYRIGVLDVGEVDGIVVQRHGLTLKGWLSLTRTIVANSNNNNGYTITKQEELRWKECGEIASTSRRRECIILTGWEPWGRVGFANDRK
jgi:hypothetical protein